MVRFTIIIPKWLNDWLTEQANIADRSKTKQIEWLLKMLAKKDDSNY